MLVALCLAVRPGCRQAIPAVQASRRWIELAGRTTSPMNFRRSSRDAPEGAFTQLRGVVFPQETPYRERAGNHPLLWPAPAHDSFLMAVMPNDRPRVLAVLGPTNTGKTHFAVERMLGHRSGLIGFPLRLLAREIYDRIVAERGAGAAALITGEERIQPPSARYFVATVEAMPEDLEDELPRGRRDPAVRRPRARPRVHRPAAARARARRDHVSRRRHHPAADPAAGARGRADQPAALLDPDLRRAGQGDPLAPAQRRGRVHGPGGLRARRAGAAAARRRGGRARRPQSAHAQRPGRPLSGRRGRPSDRHRRDRHGPQHGHRPRHARQPDQVRRLRAAPVARARDRADRRAGRAAHARRYLRDHAGCRRSRRPDDRGGGGSRVSGAQAVALAQCRARSRLARGPAGNARCRAARAVPFTHAQRARSCQPQGARPAPAGARSRRHAGRRASAVGGVPDPGFPQDADRRPSASSGDHLRPPRRARSPAGRLGGRPGGASGAGRRRHRRPDRPARAHPHLDLRRLSGGLAGRCGPLAGAHARGRGCAERCLARAADPALHRSAHAGPAQGAARGWPAGADRR